MADSQALVVRSSTNVAALDEFDDAILNGTSVELLDDPDVIAREIVAQLLAATTDEELEPTEAESWRELPDVPIELREFTWRKSSIDPNERADGALDIFVVLHGFALDGYGNRVRPVVLTTGARNVLAQISNMARRGVLSGKIRAIRPASKKTKRGFEPLWLYTPEEVVAARAEAMIEGEVVEDAEVVESVEV